MPSLVRGQHCFYGLRSFIDTNKSVSRGCDAGVAIRYQCCDRLRVSPRLLFFYPAKAVEFVETRAPLSFRLMNFIIQARSRLPSLDNQDLDFL